MGIKEISKKLYVLGHSDLAKKLSLSIPKSLEEFKDSLIYNGDGTYDSDDDVYVPEQAVKNGKLLIKFRHVKGTFYSANLGLITLIGCPKIVDGAFYSHGNNYDTLEGSPEVLNGDYFNCRESNLKSLKGCTKIIHGNFSCSDNMLKSVDYAPKIVYGNFYCYGNYKIFTEEEIKKVCDVKGRIFTK